MGLPVRWAGASVALCAALLAPAAAEGRFTVTGGTITMTLDASLDCTRLDEHNPCHSFPRARITASQHTAATFEVVPGTVTEPSLTHVPLRMTSGTHAYRHQEEALPYEDGSRCASTTTTTDSGLSIPDGPSWGALFEEFGSEPFAPELKLVGIGSDLAVAEQPITQRTVVEHDCFGERTSTFAMPLGDGLEGVLLWNLPNVEIVDDHPRRTVDDCPPARACDRTYSGVLRRSARAIPDAFDWADGSGSFHLSQVVRWRIDVRRGGAPDPSEDSRRPDDDDRPESTSFWDLACGVGDPVAGFGAGFAGLVSESPASALGPLGLGLGLANLGCTAFDLWDTPVDDPESAIAAGACAGLTTFSFGMGAGSMFLAGSVVGLPAAAVGGFVSLLGGAAATIACAGVPDGGELRVRGAQMGDDYRRIARPRRVILSVPTMPRGTPSAVRARLRALAGNTGAMLGARDALNRCLLRRAAAATAGEAAWEARQRACAADNARRLAAGFRRHAMLHGRLARAVRASGMRQPPIGRRAARATARTMPRALARRLRRLGASRSDVRRLRRLAARRAGSMPLPRTLAAGLTQPSSRRAFMDAGRAFDRLARRLDGERRERSAHG